MASIIANRMRQTTSIQGHSAASIAARTSSSSTAKPPKGYGTRFHRGTESGKHQDGGAMAGPTPVSDGLSALIAGLQSRRRRRPAQRPVDGPPPEPPAW